MAYAASDQEGQAWVAAFREGLQKLGWTEGRNIQTDTRWTPRSIWPPQPLEAHRTPRSFRQTGFMEAIENHFQGAGIPDRQTLSEAGNRDSGR